MTVSRRVRRLRRAAVGGLACAVAAALPPLLGPAAPVAAAPDCLTEAGLPLSRCDDSNPPETTVSTVAPSVNSAGYVLSTTVTFTFSGVFDDGDGDVIKYECMLYNTASPPDEDVPSNWTSCASGDSYAGLEQSKSTPYTFKVRAYDETDRAIVMAFPETDEPDHDLSAATVTFKVDTVSPNSFITRGPVDDIRPDWPATSTASPQLVLDSSEAGGFRCSLNGQPVVCADGPVRLQNLSGGAKTFVAQAVDAAGNVDPTPAVMKFFVPSDIDRSKRSGWRRVNKAGYFGDDLLKADKIGATLKVKRQRHVREVRLLAPAGPKLGKLEVRVGRSQWYTVDLQAKTAVRQRVYLVRDHFSPPRSGTILIRVKQLRRGGSVAVDALVARG